MIWIIALVVLALCFAKPKVGIPLAALVAFAVFVFMGGLMPGQPEFSDTSLIANSANASATAANDHELLQKLEKRASK